MKEEIINYINEFKDGTKTMFKEFFNKKTNKKQRANMWTFSRLVSAFVIPICSVVAVTFINPILFGVAGALTAFGAITDYFDGKSARKHKSYSEYGKKLDQVTDKIFTVLVGSSLVLINPIYIITLLAEGIIAGINVNYSFKHKDLKINSTLIGRIKQWPLCISLALGFLSPISNILLTISNSSIIITLLLQLLTAGSYIKQNNNEIKKIDIQGKNILLDEFESEDKEKVKSLEFTKNNNTIEINKTQPLSRTEQLKTLKSILTEISIEEQNETSINVLSEIQDNNSLGNQKSIKK